MRCCRKHICEAVWLDDFFPPFFLRKCSLPTSCRFLHRFDQNTGAIEPIPTYHLVHVQLYLDVITPPPPRSIMIITNIFTRTVWNFESMQGGVAKTNRSLVLAFCGCETVLRRPLQMFMFLLTFLNLSCFSIFIIDNV